MTRLILRWFFVGLVTIGVLAIPHDSLATTICAPEPPCEYVLNPRKTAFVGAVVRNTVRLSANRLVYEVVTEFLTEEVFGARVESLVSIATNITLTPEAARTLFLPRGASYLVYGELKDGAWQPGHCSSPIRLADATKDLEALRAATIGPRESMLSGSVSMTTWDEGIGPAPDITVTATRRVDGQVSSDAYETRANARGRFRFRGLPTGEYVVAPNVEPPLKAKFERQEIVELRGCTDGVSLFLTTASFGGTVRGADGAPVKGARIRAVEADALGSASYRRDVFTDAAGRWSIDGVPDGRYLINLNALSGPSAENPYLPQWYPGVAEESRAETVTLGHDRPRRINFRLPPPIPVGTITGGVVDTAGRPVAGASVSVEDAAFPLQAASSVQTDTRGRFSVRAVVGRALLIRAHYYAGGKKFVSEAQSVVLVEPDDRTPATLEIWFSTWEPVAETGKR